MKYYFKKFILITAILSLMLGSCSDSGDKNNNEGEDIGPVGELDNAGLTTIKEFVLSQAYSQWTAQPSVQAATGNSPHGAARVFFNDTLVQALQSNTTIMPKGSIVVKEIYEADLTTLKGFALDAKIKDGEGPNTWIFYEGFTPNHNNYHGIGLSTCTGCHSTGTDYLRTLLP